MNCCNDINASNIDGENIMIGKNTFLGADNEICLSQNINSTDSIIYSSNLVYGKKVLPKIGLLPQEVTPIVKENLDHATEMIGFDNDTYKTSWFIGLDRSNLEKSNEDYYSILKTHILRST